MFAITGPVTGCGEIGCGNDGDLGRNRVVQAAAVEWLQNSLCGRMTTPLRFVVDFLSVTSF